MTQNTKDLIELLTKIYTNENEYKETKIKIWTKEGDYFITFYNNIVNIEVK